MPLFGRGHKAHVTGSCHDERGMRNVVDAEALDHFVRTLANKVKSRRDELVEVEAEDTEDAEVILLGWGIVGRAARAIAREGREQGLRVGSVRPLTVWPFADRELNELCGGVRRVLVMENNLGQLLPYVRSAIGRRTEAEGLLPQVLGTLHRPDAVLARIREVLR